MDNDTDMALYKNKQSWFLFVEPVADQPLREVQLLAVQLERAARSGG
jgi:hypothetical protein